MPYYRHLKSAEPSLDGDSFDTMQDARVGIDPKTHTVTYVQSSAELDEWTTRERNRYRDDIYIRPPWFGGGSVSTVRSYENHYIPELVTHYPHVLADGMIEYTKTAEHGMLDRKTTTTPGRYLTEYYKNVLSPTQIADYVDACKAENNTFKLTRDGDEIAAIYSRKDCGFSSCMQFKASPEYSFQRPTERGERDHPVVVYGDSDLALAYLGEIETRKGKITARAIVWPEKKTFVRVYGDSLLKTLLRRAGYTAANPEGAHVRYIENDRGVLMPYIDGISEGGIVVTLADGRKMVKLLGEEDTEDMSSRERRDLLSTTDTCGYGDGSDDGEDEDDDQQDDDDHDTTCQNCHIQYAYESQSNGARNHTLCDACCDRQTQCTRCDSWQDDTTTIEGYGEVCEHCADVLEIHCKAEIVVGRTFETDGTLYGAGSIVQCDQTWYDVSFSDDERNDRESRGVAHLCMACAADRMACRQCHAIIADDSDLCPNCGRMPRLCERTADLFGFQDGSIWWRRRSDGLHGARWILTADGRKLYATHAGAIGGTSNFDTLDDSSDFLRVPNPRSEPIPEESVF